MYSDEKFTGFKKKSFPMNLYLYMEEMILFLATQVQGLNSFE